MIKINKTCPSDLIAKLKRFWQISEEKINLIERNYDVSKGLPVFTIKGNYTTRGWTEWTQGFLYGSVILQYDVTGDKSLLKIGRKKIVEVMAPHIAILVYKDSLVRYYLRGESLAIGYLKVILLLLKDHHGTIEKKMMEVL